MKFEWQNDEFFHCFFLLFFSHSCSFKWHTVFFYRNRSVQFWMQKKTATRNKRVKAKRITDCLTKRWQTAHFVWTSHLFMRCGIFNASIVKLKKKTEYGLSVLMRVKDQNIIIAIDRIVLFCYFMPNIQCVHISKSKWINVVKSEAIKNYYTT